MNVKIRFEDGFDKVYKDCLVRLNSSNDWIDVIGRDINGEEIEHSYRISDRNSGIKSIEIVVQED